VYFRKVVKLSFKKAYPYTSDLKKPAIINFQILVCKLFYQYTLRKKKTRMINPQVFMLHPFFVLGKFC